MSKTSLLASAGSLDAIAKSVAAFYCGEAKNLVEQEPGTWAICTPSTGKLLAGVRVVKARGRFRFEMV
jgi:hypothetical protein